MDHSNPKKFDSSIRVALVVLLFFSQNSSANCLRNYTAILKDRAGTEARILESHDCFYVEGGASQGSCLSLNSATKRQEAEGGGRLTGFRSHRTLVSGREFAFVESIGRGAPFYKTGAFIWDYKDVKGYSKLPNVQFLGGESREIRFDFDPKLRPPFESLATPPAELSGKVFRFSQCAEVSSQASDQFIGKTKDLIGNSFEVYSNSNGFILVTGDGSIKIYLGKDGDAFNPGDQKLFGPGGGKGTWRQTRSGVRVGSEGERILQYEFPGLQLR